MNALQQFENNYKESLGKTIPEFQAGDTVKVNYKIIEGEKERIQVYQGLCIARKNAGINSSFNVRKISYGEGVERIFPLYSPRIDSIEVIRKGEVRRAKLYYMRKLTGKAARIEEKQEKETATAAE
ncbi:MAG TPA: 50S ribosomal protein L19 [Alphaproteobacteria bacterium]|nr:50S ribosomal protein L19 [Alphaproteobacteria bacterium]